MATITLRSEKGRMLTNGEVDDNWAALREIITNGLKVISFPAVANKLNYTTADVEELGNILQNKIQLVKMDGAVLDEDMYTMPDNYAFNLADGVTVKGDEIIKLFYQ